MPRCLFLVLRLGASYGRPRLEHSGCARLLTPCGHLGNYRQVGMPVGPGLRMYAFILADVFIRSQLHDEETPTVFSLYGKESPSPRRLQLDECDRNEVV